MAIVAQSEIRILPAIPSAPGEASELSIATNPQYVLLYDAPVFTDATADAIDPDADDVMLWPSPIGLSADYIYIGYSEKFRAVKFNISTAGIGTYSNMWQYYDGSWVHFLTHITSSNANKNIANDEEEFKSINADATLVFNVPDDWEKTTVDGKNAYWIGAYVYSGTVTTSPLAQQIWVEPVEFPQYDIFLIIDNTQDKIFKNSGFTETILDSFSSSAFPSGICLYNGDLYTCDNDDNDIHRHSMITSSIINSISSPASDIYGIIFESDDLITCDFVTESIYIHSGFSTVIQNSFNAGLIFNDIDVDSDGNLLAITALNKIYKFVGTSSVISTSFSCAGTNMSSIGWYGDGLLSGTSAVADELYKHDTGFSSVIIDTINSPPGTGLRQVRGINWARTNIRQDLIFSYDIGSAGTLTFNYKIHTQELKDNLIISDANEDRIYANQGVTDLIVDSFASPASLPSGVAFDGTNIISCDSITDIVYIHSGFSTIITNSFSALNFTGLSIKGDDLVSCRVSPAFISQHVGFTSSLNSTFSSPTSAPSDVAWDGGTLGSASVGAYGQIYIHDGFSNIITNSWLAPGCYGLTFDKDGSVVAGRYLQNYITIYSGKTNSISSTFSSPGDYTSGLYYYTNLRTNTLRFNYNMFPLDVLVTTDATEDKIYLHSGISDVIISSYNSVSGDPVGSLIDTTVLRLIILESNPDKFYIHAGFSENITDSFGAPAYNPYGATFDGTNIVSCDLNTDRIYVHSGVSATITTSFSTPDNRTSDLAYDGLNLLSVDNGNQTVYVHVGTTAVISDSFLGPYSGLLNGVETDKSGNLLTATFIGLPDNGMIVIHSGITSTLDSTFNSPSVNPVSMAYYSNYINKNLPFSYDIVPVPEYADLVFSYDLGIIGDLIHSDPVNDLIYRHNRLTEFIIETFNAPAENITGITVAKRVTPIVDLTFSYDIGDFSSSETDVEVFIASLVPSAGIEIYIPGDAKYECDADEITLSKINIQMQKDHGVSRIGNMTINLSNLDGRYSESNPASIFYNQQRIKNPIRIKSGWGSAFDTDIETHFQGMLKQLSEDENRSARFTAYDTMKKLFDFTFETETVINSSNNPGMNPASIVEYLINEIADIRLFDMDYLYDVDLLDAGDLATAIKATETYTILPTAIKKNTKLINALQDLMKIVQGYLYCGKDGKLHIYIYEPFVIPASVRSFTGSEDASPKQIIKMKKYSDEDQIINVLNWTYNTAAGTGIELTVTNEASVQKYGEKTLDLSVLWDVSEDELTATAERTFARYSEPPRMYEPHISWLDDGEAMKINLGDIIEITDDAISETNRKIFVMKMGIDVQKQITDFICEDAGALSGKFAIASSEIDEGDGRGITANDFNNWRERFGFAGNAEIGDPHNDGSNPGFDPSGNNNGVVDRDYGVLDAWENALEEIFICW